MATEVASAHVVWRDGVRHEASNPNNMSGIAYIYICVCNDNEKSVKCDRYMNMYIYICATAMPGLVVCSAVALGWMGFAR